MKLYAKPGSCSLAAHIVANEANLTLNIENVDLGKKVTETGANYWEINPKGQVPALLLDDGSLLTEGPVVAQYLADMAPESGLMPAAGTVGRYQVMSWQCFITSELHKGFSPLFNSRYDANAKSVAADILKQKLSWVDTQLSGQPYLTGNTFTVADAYLFTVVGWAKYVKLDLADLSNLQAFMDRVAARPAVVRARQAEGLI